MAKSSPPSNRVKNEFFKAQINSCWKLVVIRPGIYIRNFLPPAKQIDSVLSTGDKIVCDRNATQAH